MIRRLMVLYMILDLAMPGLALAEVKARDAAPRREVCPALALTLIANEDFQGTRRFDFFIEPVPASERQFPFRYNHAGFYIEFNQPASGFMVVNGLRFSWDKTDRFKTNFLVETGRNIIVIGLESGAARTISARLYGVDLTVRKLYILQNEK